MDSAVSLKFRSMRYEFKGVFVFGLLISALAPSVAVAEDLTDGLVLSEIFAEQQVERGSLDVESQVRELPPAEQFEVLRNWVLPSPGHATFRLSGGFRPLRVGSTPQSESLKSDVPRSPLRMADRILPSPPLASPALDLIDVAWSIGRLEELRDVLVDSKPTSLRQQFNRATLSFLVEVAREDTSAAITAFDRVIALSLKLDRSTWESRWPTILMIRSTLHIPNLRRIVCEFAFSAYTDLEGWSQDQDLDVVNDHLRMLQGINRLLDDHSIEAVGTLLNSRDPLWQPFSYTDSATLALGRPRARWTVAKGEVVKRCGHEVDWLGFAIPLRGDFEIECDFTTAHAQDISFMPAGRHIQPALDGQTIRVGNFRKHVRDTPLAAPITALNKWSRYRAVFCDGTLTEFVNGEPVRTRRLLDDHNPWFGLRSWRRSQGVVRDVRITGNPDIPDEVGLVTDAYLDGWAPFYEQGFGANGNWSGVALDDGSVEIRGRRHPELDGMAVEKLLRYYRPLFEDGVLTYEFFYREGKSAVYPVLDDMAFILQPSDVTVHELTHRNFERLGRDPAEVRSTSRGEQHTGSVPLIDNTWNRVTIEIKDQQLSLSVNESAVFADTVESHYSPVFGLFHFADRTSARARNVIWRGDWPRELPELAEQTLASQSLTDLESRVERLPLAVNHGFQKDLPDELFDFSRGPGGTLKLTPDGLRIDRSGVGGNTDLFTCLQLHGDFEIVASFDDLAVEMPEPRWNAGIGLRLAFETEEKHRCSLFRSTARNASNRRAQFYESSALPDGSRRHSGDYLVEESRSGRLRLVRSGGTVFGFYGPGDSPHDRLIAKLKVTTAPTTVRGLSLGIEGPAPTTISTYWKSLQIRAERVTAQPIRHSAAVTRRLNEHRRRLTERRLDFSDPEQANEYSTRNRAGASYGLEESGLRMTARSSGSLSEANVYCPTPRGDSFDLEASIAIHQFDAPLQPHRHSEVTMRVLLIDEQTGQRGDIEEASLLLRQKGDGRRELVARVVRINSAGKRTYRPIRTVTVESPDHLRIAQADGSLWFLYSEEGSSETRTFAKIPQPADLASQLVILSANALDNEHVTDATVKSLRISTAPAAE